MRFDEVELESVPLGIEDDATMSTSLPGEAPRGKRLLALLTDVSLFAALTLALAPLLSQPQAWQQVASLAGFVIVVSYYYFVGTWMLWGKTVGGAIFDVRVVSEAGSAVSLRDASMRWLAVCLSLLLGGLGFAMAILPSRRSLPDRLSQTKCV